MWNSIYDYQININTMKKILLLALPLMVMCFASCNKEEWTDDSPLDFVNASPKNRPQIMGRFACAAP